MITNKNKSIEELNEIYLKIHNIIHSDLQNIIIDGVTIPVIKSNNNCRKINWNNITFMEQNKASYKKSSYADRARAGEKLTWAINGSNWKLITDKGINL